MSVPLSAPLPQRILLPNIGAEEGRPQTRAEQGMEDLAVLWSAVFPEDETELADRKRTTGAVPGLSLEDRRRRMFVHLREHLPAEPAFAPLAPVGTLRGGVAWLPDPPALAWAEQRGISLAAPAPEVVRLVHDKAFAFRFAGEHQSSVEHTESSAETPPGELHACMDLFEPDELRDTAAVLQRLRTRWAQWPREAGERFVLKPRWGTSGRGRVQGRVSADRDEIRALLTPRALDKLALRGGAILEPWLDRLCDYSTQLWIDPAGEVEILGTTRQHLNRHGVYLGNQGVLEREGEGAHASTGPPALHRAAVELGRAAARRGYFGPCGVDALSYQWGRERRLRTVVELNARFTTGHIALAFALRAAHAIGEDLAGEMALAWFFSLGPGVPQPTGPRLRRIPLLPAEARSPKSPLDPVLILGRPEDLDQTGSATRGADVRPR